MLNIFTFFEINLFVYFFLLPLHYNYAHGYAYPKAVTNRLFLIMEMPTLEHFFLYLSYNEQDKTFSAC